MSLSALVEGDVDRYLRENADNGTDLWLYIHIPKTAGSSFRSEIAQRLRPQRNIHFKVTADMARSGVSAATRMNLAVDAFIAECRTDRIRFASGHLDMAQAARIRESVSGTRVITMLRHPVPRLVSHYRYARTPIHPTYKDSIARYPTFESFLDDPNQHNAMVRTLSRGGGTDVAATIRDMTETFSFVGIYERYEASFSTFFSLLGEDTGPTIYKRKTEDTPDNRISDLASFEERIVALNRADMELYDHFSRLYCGSQVTAALRQRR
jgi:hypothetical protein